MTRDFRDAIRGVWRAPGLAAAAVALLGLGIGANTVMFSVVDAAMFKPLPYAQPDQLVEALNVRNAGTSDEVAFTGLSWPTLDRWRAEPGIFVGSAILDDFRRVKVTGVTVTTDATLVGRMSPAFVPLLGVAPELGRAFDETDATQAAPVLLLSDAFWRTAFNADRTVVGRTVSLDGRAYTVIGVMPPTFGYGVAFGSTVGWELFDEKAERAKSTLVLVHTFFRLRPGLTLEAAERQLVALQAASPTSKTVTFEISPMDYRSVTMGNARVALPVLLAVVGCVLLIACANVANLVLARAMTRRRELAVRAALGATRGRLVSQMMAESAILTGAGTVAALVIAAWSTRIVPVLVPASMHLFDANAMRIDGRAFACCALAAVVTLLTSGLVPAIRASRPNMLASLGGGRAVTDSTPGGRRLRQVLQAGQVALTLVLLVATSLLASSFARMMWADPGFNINGLVTTGRFSWPAGQYPKANAQLGFMETMLARARTLPGVRAAAIGPSPTAGFGGPFIPLGRPSSENESTGPRLSVLAVSSDYLATVGIPIRQGRGLSASDTLGSQPVALIDEDAAAHYWPGASPIGRQFRYTLAAAPFSPPVTVVGIVGHVKTLSYAAATGSIQVYLPVAQQPSNATGLVLRVDGDPGAALGAISRLATSLDSRAAMNQPAVVAEMYGDTYVAPRFYVTVVSIFAVLALATASVGLFSLLSYAVGERTREIGVRLALGADRRRIQFLVLADAMAPVAAGLAVGLMASLWLTRALKAVLFGVTPHDLAAYLAAVVALVAAAVLAAMLPARRATRVDPVVALRDA